MRAGKSKWVPVFRKFVYFLLYIFLLTPLAYGEDDAMETAIKSIWPDKDIEVVKAEDSSSFGGVTLTSYGAAVLEGGYEYQVHVTIVPDNSPADLMKIMNAKPVEVKEYEVKDIDPPVWITRAQLVVYVDENGKRKNKYISQRTDFRCKNTYVSTYIYKDSGSSKTDLGFQFVDSPKSVHWTAKLLPLSKDFAEKAAAAVCIDCNADKIYSFYKKYLNTNLYSSELTKNYDKGQQRAFDIFPSQCPQQTKQAMLKLVKGGFDAPKLMWELTFKGRGEYSTLVERQGVWIDPSDWGGDLVLDPGRPGIPPDYIEFKNNLGKGLQEDDVIVRRFRYQHRKRDLSITLAEMESYAASKIQKIIKAWYERHLQAIGEKSKIHEGRSDSVLNTAQIAGNLLGSEINNDAAFKEYIYKDEQSQLNFGADVVKEIIYYGKTVEALNDLEALEDFNAEMSFDQVQGEYPESRRAYEKALIQSAASRVVMRRMKNKWDQLQKMNEGIEIAQWPAEDKEAASLIFGPFKGNDPTDLDNSPMAKTTASAQRSHQELIQNKDILMITWDLMGYKAINVPPPMEVLY